MSSSEMAYLPCKIEEGMFSDEYAVKVEVDGKTLSLFADESLIEKEGENNVFLHVLVQGDNGKPGYKSVLLPTESFETGSRWLSVPEQLLQYFQHH